MPTNITEASAITPAPVGNRWRARIIEGDIWGSSGYYPAEVLERDGAATWPQGTAVFFDHPGENERYDRPERSVRDLAGRIASTPAYEGDGLYADIEFYSHAAPIVKEMAGDIGLSIRAAATIENGEAAGKSGPIVQALHEGLSVDLVTKAGAGGKLVSLMESARPLLVIDEAPARPQIPATDPTNIPHLTGTDVPAPAGRSNATESKETTMATTQIEEAELGHLREDSQRVQTAESARDAAIAERDTARTELAVFRAREAARPAIATRVAESGLPARRQTRIVESVLATITADSTDPATVAAATEAAVTEAQADMAEIAEALGVGKVRGLGGITGPEAGEVSEADYRAAMYGTEQKGA